MPYPLNPDHKTAPSDEFPFHHAIECGLVLLMHKQSGRTLYFEEACWRDLVLGIAQSLLPEELASQAKKGG